MSEQLLIGLGFATIISAASFAARLLTFWGALAQFVLGFVLLGFGGWQWTFPILVFFISSSLMSKYRKELRSKLEASFEKSSRRDALQVVANGGVAGIITLLWFLSNDHSLYVAYLGSIAAATADTWGTEIGIFSRSSPVLITTFQRVEAGRSGAVSVLGLYAGVLGSLTIFCSSLFWSRDWDFVILVSVLLGGIGGSLVDSLLGATVQLQYRCGICGKLTERQTHCSASSLKVLGLPWMKNDQVNLICTISGGLLSWVLSKALLQ